MKLSKHGQIFMGASFVAAIALMVQAAAVWAQDTQDNRPPPVSQTEFYVKQVQIDKVYTAAQGYIVQYRTGVLADKKVRVAIPYTWFDKSKATGAGAKGEVVQLGSGKVWPHLVVYYKSGEFDHIRLYVSKYPNHQTWGTAYDSPAVQQLFSEAENWKL